MFGKWQLIFVMPIKTNDAKWRKPFHSTISSTTLFQIILTSIPAPIPPNVRTRYFLFSLRFVQTERERENNVNLIRYVESVAKLLIPCECWALQPNVPAKRSSKCINLAYSIDFEIPIMNKKFCMARGYFVYSYVSN